MRLGVLSRFRSIGSYMGKILPLGSVLALDSEGYLSFEPDLGNIQPHWRALLDEVVEMYRGQLGENVHGVYVRGTVAKCAAIDGVSDLDTFAITYTGEEQIQPEWSLPLVKEIESRHSFSQGVECIVLPMSSLEKVRPPKKN